jgi:SulP family sulfate permease
VKNERAPLQGDIFGGLTAAVIALPLAVAFGVASVAPLGPEYAPTGALVGLLGAIFTGFFAALFGGTAVQVTGPTGPMTVVLTSFIAASMVGRSAEGVPAVLVLTGFTVALGGLLQIGIGASGGGKIVKYIPYPVVAGFMNGIAVIIFLGQIKPFLGISGDYSSFRLEAAGVPVAIGVATIAAILITRRLSKTVPSSLVGLLVGVGAYLAFGFFESAPMRATDNPLLVGPIPNPFGSLEQVQRMLPVLQTGQLGSLTGVDIQRAITSAVTLAVLGSIDSLLTSVVADSVTHTRHDSRKELFGQGIGNVVNELFGGLAGAGATVRTLVNVNAGGTTRRSGMIHSAVILVVVVALGTPAGWIPMSALAGILFVTAVGMVDKYSLQLVKHRRARGEFSVMLIVTGVTVAVDLMIAVGIGVAIAAVLFIAQLADAGVVRRKLRGSELLSRRVRKPEQLELLREHGESTAVYELEGSLFFGTTDALLTEVEADGDAPERVVFDFSRVRNVDLSGVRLLLSIVERLRERKKLVVFSGLAAVEARCPSLHEMLIEQKVLATVGEEHVYATLDRALEACEEDLLTQHALPVSVAQPLELHGYDAFSQLTDEEATVVSTLLVEQSVDKGEVLFKEGAPADSLALVRSGRFAVVRDSRRGEVRLATLGRGEIWDGRVFVDAERWQTSLTAEEASSVFLLSRAALEQLRAEQPSTHDHLERSVLRSVLARFDALKIELVLLEES